MIEFPPLSFFVQVLIDIRRRQHTMFEYYNRMQVITMKNSKWIQVDPTWRKNFAASAQHFLVEKLIETIDSAVTSRHCRNFSGIVFTGGVAFNTLASTALIRHYGLPVHVPADPGDGGCAMGLLWHVLMAKNNDLSERTVGPQQMTEHLALGLPLYGVEQLPALASKCGAKLFRTPTGQFDFAAVAKLLCEQHHVMGIVRGRQQVGNAVAGRNLIFAPTISSERVSELRSANGMMWFEPFSIVMLEESMVDLLDERPSGTHNVSSLFYSPYGLLSPRLRREVSDRYPFVVDGRSQGRVQTVWASFSATSMFRFHKNGVFY